MLDLSWRMAFDPEHNQLRDAVRIFGGTSEIVKEVIGRAL